MCKLILDYLSQYDEESPLLSLSLCEGAIGGVGINLIVVTSKRLYPLGYRYQFISRVFRL